MSDVLEVLPAGKRGGGGRYARRKQQGRKSSRRV
jgi:hypothetical protein